MPAQRPRHPQVGRNLVPPGHRLERWDSSRCWALLRRVCTTLSPGGLGGGGALLDWQGEGSWVTWVTMPRVCPWPPGVALVIGECLGHCFSGWHAPCFLGFSGLLCRPRGLRRLPVSWRALSRGLEDWATFYPLVWGVAVHPWARELPWTLLPFRGAHSLVLRGVPT